MAEPIVRQRFAYYADDTEVGPMLSRVGAEVVVPFRDQLAMAGYCFVSTGTAAAGDGETGEVAASAFTLDPLEPSFMFDIPEGTTVLPLEANIAGESWGTGHTVAIMSDSVKRYASGGVAAVVARNIRTNSPRGSNVENLYSGDTAITASAASTERLHMTWISPDNLNAAEGLGPPVINWLPDPFPVLVGPASFLVYSHVTNGQTAAEFRISVTWAELPTTLIEK